MINLKKLYIYAVGVQRTDSFWFEVFHQQPGLIALPVVGEAN
jgi:hypothetical protein